MHDMTQSGILNAPPDVVTYTTLITCHGLSKLPGAPQRAEKIVRHMDELHRAGHLREGPSVHTFIALRKAWKYSAERNSTEAVEAVDREMLARFRTRG